MPIWNQKGVYLGNRANAVVGIVTSGLVLNLDAGNTSSYSGSGTTWSDLSGSGNNLTLFNSPTFTSGLAGYFTFNGSTQYARRSIFYTSATAWSMVAIIRPSNLNQLSNYMQNGRDDGVNAPFNGYGIGLGNGSSTGSATTGAKLQVIHGGITYVNPEYTFASTSPWYYVVATRDTTTSTYYVNGTQTSLTSTSAPNAPTDVFSVGAGTSSTAAARYFAGDIAVVLFYSKQLTQAEINQNFNAFRGRYGI